MITVTNHDGVFALEFPYDPILVSKVKAMPQRKWDKESRSWKFKPTLANIEYVNKWFPDAKWDPETESYIEAAEGRKAKREETIENKSAGMDYSVLDGVPFKLTPFQHQEKALLLGREPTSFAYLMDQGTGKTKVLLDDAAYHWRKGEIDAILVIAPNSVKTNWVDPGGGEDEVSKHLAPDVPYNKGCWMSSPNKDQNKEWTKFLSRLGEPNCLHILSVNIEGLHDKSRSYSVCVDFVLKHNVLIVIDESTRIKNRTTKRTKAAVKLRANCPYARIMTGTPIIKSPLDAFSQFNFLDVDILGFENYYSFLHHHAVMGGYQGKQVLFYTNLDELSARINSCSYRIMKEECLDLPKKTYVKRRIEMSKEQSKAYTSMSVDAIIRLEEISKEKGTITADTKLVELLRLQQITSGYLPVIENGEVVRIAQIGKFNPKIEEAVSIVEECNHKVIIWARFINEIELVSKRLHDAGIDNVTFYGKTKEAERVNARRRFQDPDSGVQVFVGQIRTGGFGLTLTAGRTIIYLSNSFSTEDRVQSEDRAHRIGQEHPVLYIDLICEGTVDVKIISTLRGNKKISDSILKDDFKEWI